MLKVRVIPTLLYRDFGVVKGTGFDSWRHVGSPMQALKVYNLRDVDELIFVDVTATNEERQPDYQLIDELADDCFMPMTVGGGVGSVEHARELLAVGADKVALNTAAVEDGRLVADIAERFGSQCVVVSIDYRRTPEPVVFTHSGRVDTRLHPVELAKRVAGDGAGEILLTSVERDGTMSGYDVEIVAAVADAVTVPVIASGGAGSYADMASAIDAGASAVAAGAMFHFTEATPGGAREHLRELGHPVRRSV